MIVHCYVGLPGSGKSYRAQQDFQAAGDGIFLDDSFDVVDLTMAFETNISNVFITDPTLCDPKIRDKFLRLLSQFNPEKVVWNYFENDPVKAINNIRHRDDGRLISATAIKDYFSAVYEIPDGVEVIPIWQP